MKKILLNIKHQDRPDTFGDVCILQYKHIKGQYILHLTPRASGSSLYEWKFNGSIDPFEWIADELSDPKIMGAECLSSIILNQSLKNVFYFSKMEAVDAFNKRVDFLNELSSQFEKLIHKNPYETKPTNKKKAIIKQPEKLIVNNYFFLLRKRYNF